MIDDSGIRIDESQYLLCSVLLNMVLAHLPYDFVITVLYAFPYSFD